MKEICVRQAKVDTDALSLTVRTFLLYEFGNSSPPPELYSGGQPTLVMFKGGNMLRLR